MTHLRNRILHLNSGRQIKLYGDSIAINQSLEIGEGYAPNILTLSQGQQGSNIPAGLANPYGLTVDELMELADFNIQLWMNLKTGLRHHGGIDPKIFHRETAKETGNDQENSKKGRKKKNAGKDSQ